MEPVNLDDFGGPQGVRELVEVFYGLVERSPVLRPLFPPTLEEAKDKQALYFIEFLGGGPVYTEKHGKPFLRFKHRHAVIGRDERDAWLACLGQALEQTVSEETVRKAFLEKIMPIADAMVNSKPGQKDAYYFNTPSETLS